MKRKILIETKTRLWSTKHHAAIDCFVISALWIGLSLMLSTQLEVRSGLSCHIPVQDQRTAITGGFNCSGWMIISNWPCAGVPWYKWSVDQTENKDNSAFFSFEKVLLISFLSVPTIILIIIKLGTKYRLFRFWNMNVKVSLIVMSQICSNDDTVYLCR